MFFRKRGKLRKEESDRLLRSIESMKERLDNEKHYVSHSVDPSDDVLARMRATESAYTFLLREARTQKMRQNKLVR
ncbi:MULTISPECIES: YaaL family protein [Alkalihalophilus]|uniref:DUF2508 domain-containing protein n=2 Tax=Alkalihalophilus pseudofirmus TaxID=79885 RepID=D3FQX6_ALKPO|nr:MULTISPECIES: YaaL family protein [Alkalihalophilus]ADC49672.1 hypothetical protein BpOF4_08070 [Alkalihalophilus pseudofirmus OF4]MDV2887412.1 YaaL family protein [Alkalihalophilus pseudofirmus]MEC2074283.1 YaaL family protein [Alkalihalophilus marmarensis]MED1600737.1 YaaL family protein [Alkalihalophilus marmarensis]OLS33906.1 hypothetical protein BTR22_19885 [Alkalihalophilus pseudofirmus]